ncbi:ORF6C domain-containing protein [Virgibacillus chiguensis]|uniref:Phage regulatory protein, rha family n=1 Tax=Virgibacillus chiguensis TaxID=411959 RepID=A0A1M5VHM9_9BACI|nr:ORF6C domain-containing protein [Virgibacillus chiguensis]SHH74685.1 phage regulatory protein, rha family [Virgibacillus chiguensis]
MKQLVFIQNDKVLTDTLTVAEVFAKPHDKVVRDVKVQITKLHEAGEHKWSTANFGETQYQHLQNKQWYTKFDLTEDAFAIIAMSYTTPEAMKMKVKFLSEFKAMKEKLQQPRVLSDKERLMASLKLTLEASETLEQHNERLTSLEETMRIDGAQEHALNKKGKRIVMESLGGKSSPAYKQMAFKVFSAFWRDFKDYFQIPRYGDLPKKKYEEGLRFIGMWQPSTSLKIEIDEYNNQQTFNEVI